MKTTAFTLIEYIIVILIMSIVTAVAAPKIVEVVNEAKVRSEDATVSTVKGGVNLTHSQNIIRSISPAYPAQLDNASAGTASSSNPLFADVLQPAITSHWEKLEQLR